MTRLITRPTTHFLNPAKHPLTELLHASLNKLYKYTKLLFQVKPNYHNILLKTNVIFIVTILVNSLISCIEKKENSNYDYCKEKVKNITNANGF